MTFNNTDLYCQILGSIMKEPILFHNTPSKIVMEDFCQENVAARVVFFAINSLANNDVKKIDLGIIQSFLQNYESLQQKFSRNHGIEFVEMCLDKASPENFQHLYTQLKKNSLLRDLKLHGYDISPYDFEAAESGTKKEFECIQRFEDATEDEILGYVERNFAELRARHATTSISQEYADDGIDEIIALLGHNAGQGAELRGEMFNSIVRGARLGTLYVRSASTSGGKTRSSVFDACNGVYPIVYDNERRKFIYIKDMVPQKTLFITTEQVPDEIKTMILAYISGVEERKILTNALDVSERERIHIAAKVMKKYHDYLILEEINDPNLDNVQNTIKKNILLNDVKYIYYDYIFTSPSLISQFSRNGIREDVALGMLSNQLKEIAKTYNVFVMSSTQLNGDGLQPGVKRDQRMIRGSKAIADKCDIGCIITAADSVDLEQVQEYSNKIGLVPTHVIDMYKIRSGRFKNVRIWTHYNLGNGRRKDLFITDDKNNLMDFEPYELIVSLQRAAESLSNLELEKLLERDE